MDRLVGLSPLYVHESNSKSFKAGFFGLNLTATRFPTGNSRSENSRASASVEKFLYQLPKTRRCVDLPRA